LADLQRILRELRAEFGTVSSAIISRDGTLLAGDLPASVTSETLTIMCATMMGAAVTAHSELRIGQPRMIRITSEKHEMLMIGIGRKAIIVTVVQKGARVDDLQQRLYKIVDQFIE
jgi:predicted regulator of Ras-like GTPase activity (Roadblock/LC7/MglB family)